MIRRVFEFLCENGHRSDKLVPIACRQIECPECNSVAKRVVSAPPSKLEGWSGAFPTAADAWTRDHEQRYKEAQKRKAAEQS